MKRVVTLLLIAVALTGCQKARNSTRVSTGSGARSHGLPGGSTSTPSGVQLNGSVVALNGISAEQFHVGVQDLLEAQVAREYVGNVSPTANDGTGVFIGGKVELSNGAPLFATNQNSAISGNSELLIATFDSFYTQQNMDAIPPIYFKQASGTISGNSAYLKFWDGYGFVTLEGQFDRQNFQGTLKYDTERTYNNDPQGGYYGTLGRFSVPTCQFFRCN